MLGIATYSWVYGNFKQFTYAYDPDGKGCGIDYPQYPYIYFASPHVDSLWVTVCVSACPVGSDTALKCQPNSVVTGCNAANSTDDTKKVEIYDTTLSKIIFIQLLALFVYPLLPPFKALSVMPWVARLIKLLVCSIITL
jgi:hypothetical protein